MPASFRMTPLSPKIGTEIVGLDLARPLDDDTFREIETALDETTLLVVRDQDLTPSQQVAFSLRFGPLETYPMRQFTLPDQPEVLIVSTVMESGKPIGVVDAGLYWHFDSSWRPKPSLGSVFYARELPEEGGDTLFVSMHAVYDALPEDVRRRIGRLRGIHDYVRRNELLSAKPGGRPRLTEEQRKAAPPATHPLVSKHPKTGRPSLYVNSGFVFAIEGVPEEESRSLLEYLFAFSTSPRFVYRHEWRPNDLVVWDNRSVLHSGAGCPPGMRRTMHRTTIAGDAPLPFNGSVA
jgi:taurine dioxygenase